jgi:hypothetical protein
MHAVHTNGVAERACTWCMTSDTVRNSAADAGIVRLAGAPS